MLNRNPTEKNRNGFSAQLMTPGVFQEKFLRKTVRKQKSDKSRFYKISHNIL